MLDKRIQHEIEHGQKLAASGAESVWGWETTAGKRRAIRRAKMIVKEARVQPGEEVLELGCGTGNFTELFLQSKVRIHAIDISPELLELASRRLMPSEQVVFENVRFEEMGKGHLYDAVIGSSILHHLELREALAVLFELVKPGRWICFAEPNMMNPQIALQKNIPWIKKKMGDSPDESAFFRWKLARELRNYGFQDVRVIPFDWLHPFVPARLIEIVQFFGEKLEGIPGIREFAGSILISARRPDIP